LLLGIIFLCRRQDSILWNPLVPTVVDVLALIPWYYHVNIRSFPSLVVDFVVRTDTFASFACLILHLKNLVKISSISKGRGYSYGSLVEKGSMVAKDLVVNFQHVCRGQRRVGVDVARVKTIIDSWLRFESCSNDGPATRGCSYSVHRTYLHFFYSEMRMFLQNTWGVLQHVLT
jgi:hypothetical protein